MIKRLLALLVVIIISFSCIVLSGCQVDEKEQALKQCNKSLKPTDEELKLIKGYINSEHEIFDAVKIDTPKPFVFCFVKLKLPLFDTNIWVFRFDKGKIEKIFKSQDVSSKSIKFGYLDEGIQKNSFWGMVLRGHILCPITIASEYNKYNNDYHIVKMLAINSEFDLIELQANWNGRKFKILNKSSFQTYEYYQDKGIEKIQNTIHEKGYYVDQLGKIFDLKEKSLVSDELAIKILRIYNNSLDDQWKWSDKYKIEFQLLINQLKKNQITSSNIDRMHDQLDTLVMDRGGDLPSIPLIWEISSIESEDELIFSNNWSIKMILWDIIKPLLPKDKKIINIKVYDDVIYSYVFTIVEGDEPFERGTCLYGEFGNSLMCFVFKENKLVKQEILLENSCRIEFAKNSFYNRGDPYFLGYLDMNPWGIDYEGGKIFHFINTNSSGNCWGCATSYFLLINNGEFLNLNYQSNPEDYDSSVRGVSFEDGKLVFYSVLWGYEYFRGQSHAGSPKIHLIYELENGKLVNTTKKHLRFVESEIEGAKSYTPISAMAKIAVLANEADLLDKYWPQIEEIAHNSEDERVKSYYIDLKKEYKR